MNSKMMRYGYFHLVERIHLFTDIGEKLLKNYFLHLKLWAVPLSEEVKLEIPVFSIIFSMLVNKF